MSIPVVCQCGKKFRAKDEHAGLRTKCPVCGEPLTIPQPAENKAAAPVARPPAHAPPTYEGKRLGEWLEALQADDPALRKHAAEVLSSVGPEAGAELPVIIEKLEAEHVLLRHWAVSCLERIGPAARPALDALVKRLGDDEPLIREKSAAALERVEPACAAFVARLRRGLANKDAAKRSSAVANFRRDLKTLGVSRCRFWACTCGSVYEKDDLEERLKLLADGAAVDLEGTRGCKKCGQRFAMREVYAGQHDVPKKFWPQLIKRFGDRLHVPDDLLADAAQEPQGYSLSESQMFEAFSAALPGGSSSMPVIPESNLTEGYALAAHVEVQQAAEPAEEAETEHELVPGAVVPKSGQYKCAACRKVRLLQSKSAPKAAAPPKAVVKHFKAGKTFAECPHCGDLTEWQLVD